MNKDQKNKPITKVKVRVKRAGESPHASENNAAFTEKPDLIDSVLIEALEAENTAEQKDITVISNAENPVKEETKAIQKEEPIVFVSEVSEEKISKDEMPTERIQDVRETEVYDKVSEEKKQKKKLFAHFSELSLVRKILVVLCVIFCLWSILPAFKGIIGIGLAAPLFIGLFSLFTVLAWDRICSVKGWAWKFMWLVVAVAAMIGFTAFSYVSGLMITASENSMPANNSNVTVVVLGCKVNGSEPSKMLKGRLDTAADYLLTHPGVNCIVSGGMGDDENLPEAVVMKRYLVEKGVSASRIKIEDQSRDTEENIKNSIAIADANNYYTTFCIVTDRFHQLRANMICDDNGIISYSMPCETPWYLTMNYWFREMFALAYYKLF